MAKVAAPFLYGTINDVSERRPLPKGRVYHFNMLYNHARSSFSVTEDTRKTLDWIRQAVERLQLQGAVNSYYHDRDCPKGLPLAQELTRVLASSQVTVLVLTPGFVKDCWSRYWQLSCFRELFVSGKSSSASLASPYLSECTFTNSSEYPFTTDSHPFSVENSWSSSSASSPSFQNGWTGSDACPTLGDGCKVIVVALGLAWTDLPQVVQEKEVQFFTYDWHKDEGSWSRLQDVLLSALPAGVVREVYSHHDTVHGLTIPETPRPITDFPTSFFLKSSPNHHPVRDVTRDVYTETVTRRATRTSSRDRFALCNGDSRSTAMAEHSQYSKHPHDPLRTRQEKCSNSNIHNTGHERHENDVRYGDMKRYIRCNGDIYVPMNSEGPLPNGDIHTRTKSEHPSFNNDLRHTVKSERPLPNGDIHNTVNSGHSLSIGDTHTRVKSKHPLSKYDIGNTTRPEHSSRNRNGRNVMTVGNGAYISDAITSEGNGHVLHNSGTGNTTATPHPLLTANNRNNPLRLDRLLYKSVTRNILRAELGGSTSHNGDVSNAETRRHELHNNGYGRDTTAPGFAPYNYNRDAGSSMTVTGNDLYERDTMKAESAPHNRDILTMRIGTSLYGSVTRNATRRTHDVDNRNVYSSSTSGHPHLHNRVARDALSVGHEEYIRENCNDMTNRSFSSQTARTSSSQIAYSNLETAHRSSQMADTFLQMNQRLDRLGLIPSRSRVSTLREMPHSSLFQHTSLFPATPNVIEKSRNFVPAEKEDSCFLDNDGCSLSGQSVRKERVCTVPVSSVERTSTSNAAGAEPDDINNARKYPSSSSVKIKSKKKCLSRAHETQNSSRDHNITNNLLPFSEREDSGYLHLQTDDRFRCGVKDSRESDVIDHLKSVSDKEKSSFDCPATKVSAKDEATSFGTASTSVSIRTGDRHSDGPVCDRTLNEHLPSLLQSDYKDNRHQVKRQKSVTEEIMATEHTECKASFISTSGRVHKEKDTTEKVAIKQSQTCLLESSARQEKYSDVRSSPNAGPGQTAKEGMDRASQDVGLPKHSSPSGSSAQMSRNDISAVAVSRPTVKTSESKVVDAEQNRIVCSQNFSQTPEQTEKMVPSKEMDDNSLKMKPLEGEHAHTAFSSAANITVRKNTPSHTTEDQAPLKEVEETLVTKQHISGTMTQPATHSLGRKHQQPETDTVQSSATTDCQYSVSCLNSSSSAIDTEASSSQNQREEQASEKDDLSATDKQGEPPFGRENFFDHITEVPTSVHHQASSSHLDVGLQDIHLSLKDAKDSASDFRDTDVHRAQKQRGREDDLFAKIDPSETSFLTCAKLHVQRPEGGEGERENQAGSISDRQITSHVYNVEHVECFQDGTLFVSNTQTPSHNIDIAENQPEGTADKEVSTSNPNEPTCFSIKSTSDHNTKTNIVDHQVSSSRVESESSSSKKQTLNDATSSSSKSASHVDSEGKTESPKQVTQIGKAVENQDRKPTVSKTEAVIVPTNVLTDTSKHTTSDQISEQKDIIQKKETLETLPLLTEQSIQLTDNSHEAPFQMSGEDASSLRNIHDTECRLSDQDFASMRNELVDSVPPLAASSTDCDIETKKTEEHALEQPSHCSQIMNKQDDTVSKSTSNLQLKDRPDLRYERHAPDGDHIRLSDTEPPISTREWTEKQNVHQAVTSIEDLTHDHSLPEQLSISWTSDYDTLSPRHDLSGAGSESGFFSGGLASFGEACAHTSSPRVPKPAKEKQTIIRTSGSQVTLQPSSQSQTQRKAPHIVSAGQRNERKDEIDSGRLTTEHCYALSSSPTANMAAQQSAMYGDKTDSVATPGKPPSSSSSRTPRLDLALTLTHDSKHQATFPSSRTEPFSSCVDGAGFNFSTSVTHPDLRHHGEEAADPQTDVCLQGTDVTEGAVCSADVTDTTPRRDSWIYEDVDKDGILPEAYRIMCYAMSKPEMPYFR